MRKITPDILQALPLIFPQTLNYLNWGFGSDSPSRVYARIYDKMEDLRYAWREINRPRYNWLSDRDGEYRKIIAICIWATMSTVESIDRVPPIYISIPHVVIAGNGDPRSVNADAWWMSWTFYLLEAGPQRIRNLDNELWTTFKTREGVDTTVGKALETYRVNMNTMQFEHWMSALGYAEKKEQIGAAYRKATDTMDTVGERYFNFIRDYEKQTSISPWFVSVKYTKPGRAGPLKGNGCVYTQSKPQKGDIFYSIFGQVEVVTRRPARAGDSMAEKFYADRNDVTPAVGWERSF